MFKKITAGILVLLLSLVVFAACGNDTTENNNGEAAHSPEIVAAFALYSELLALFNETNNGTVAYELEFSINMEFTSMGETMTMIMSGDISYIQNGDDMRMLMNTDMYMFGIEMPEMIMYIALTNGQAIWNVSVEGVDIGEFMTQDEVMEMVDEMMDQVNIPAIGINAIRSTTTSQSNGNTLTTLIIRGADMTEFALAQAGDLVDGDDINMNIDDVTVVITTDASNELVSMAMEMSFSFTEDGETVEASISVEYRFIAFGDDVVIPALPAR